MRKSSFGLAHSFFAFREKNMENNNLSFLATERVGKLMGRCACPENRTGGGEKSLSPRFFWANGRGVYIDLL